MVFSFVEKSKQPPTWFEMLHAIKRNFGGLEDIHVDPEGLFRVALTGKINISDQVGYSLILILQAFFYIHVYDRRMIKYFMDWTLG